MIHWRNLWCIISEADLVHDALPGIPMQWRHVATAPRIAAVAASSGLVESREVYWNHEELFKS